MPTSLPSIRPHRSLELREVATLAILVARMRALDMRMERTIRRLGRRPCARDDARLLAGARAWLDYSAQAADILGVLESPQADEMRAMFDTPLNH